MKRVKTIAIAVYFVIFGSFLLLSFSFSVFPLPAHAADILPNDPLFERQNYLQQIGAPNAWRATTGSDDVVVAVLDSGLDIDHPDLADAVWVNEKEIPGDGIDNDKNGYIDDINGWDFINDIPDPNPKFGGDFLYSLIHHGTLISGIIAARGNNGIGIAGISWKGRIMPLRVLTNQGEGSAFNVNRAIDYAIEKKADIINLSFIGNEESAHLKAAISRARAAGIIVVAAVGNNEAGGKGFDVSAKPVYPACFDFAGTGVISVGSVDALGQKTGFSNYGACIDITAPGVDMYATQAVNYERFGFDKFYGGGWTGTSLSTAVVTGVIALMKSVNPKITPVAVGEILQSTCDSVDAVNPQYAGKLGCGRVNAAAAIAAAAAQNRFSENNRTRNNLAIRIAQTDGKGAARYFSAAGKELVAGSVLRGRKLNMSAGKARVAADLNNDGKNEIITAPAKGKGALKLFSANGTLIASVFPYGKNYTNGISFAIGDLNGNGQKEIITVPKTRAPGNVIIFNGAGKKVGTFFVTKKNDRKGYVVGVVSQ